MSLESHCAACTYLSESIDSYGKFYCSRKGEYRYASDSKCYSFCEANRRSNSSRENMYGNSESHKSSGCFITTVVCEILGKEHNDEVIEKLRSFRNNVLQKNKKYETTLMEYDTIGRSIAIDKIPNDKYKNAVANCIYNYTLKSIVSLADAGKNDEAATKYRAMTLSLINRYGLQEEYKDLVENNYYLEYYNENTAGHGYKVGNVKKRTLKKKEN